MTHTTNGFAIAAHDRIRNKVLSDIEFVVASIVVADDRQSVDRVNIVYHNCDKSNHPIVDGQVIASIPFDVLKRDFVKVVEQTVEIG